MTSDAHAALSDTGTKTSMLQTWKRKRGNILQQRQEACNGCACLRKGQLKKRNRALSSRLRPRDGKTGPCSVQTNDGLRGVLQLPEPPPPSSAKAPKELLVQWDLYRDGASIAVAHPCGTQPRSSLHAELELCSYKSANYGLLHVSASWLSQFREGPWTLLVWSLALHLCMKRRHADL